MTDRHELILTCPKGLEGLLLEEATQLGLEEPREQTAAVRGYGALDVAYRLCLWSRLANRVLLVLSRFSTTDAETLYQGVHAVDWAEHMLPSGSLAVEFSGRHRTAGRVQSEDVNGQECAVESARAQGLYHTSPLCHPPSALSRLAAPASPKIACSDT